MAPTPEQKPDAFLSYTRKDDEYSGGKITIFRERLEEAIEAVTGKPFGIFQDIDGIGLGEHWPDKLDDMLDQVRFFMPMVTPRFFESKPCRDELRRFLDAERRVDRNDLILPIYFIEADVLEDESLRSEDPLAAAIYERQRYDWRELLFEPFDTKEVRVSLQNLACKIRDAVKRGTSHIVAETRQAPDEEGGQVRELEIESLIASESSKASLAGRGLNDIARTLANSSLAFLPPGTVFRDIDECWCPEMVVIPPGAFNMGSPKNEVQRDNHEGPLHRVEIEQHFALGRFPVTRGEFAVFVEDTKYECEGANILTDTGWVFDESASWRSPGFAQDDSHPVVSVSYQDALAYLDWLGEKSLKHYVLPSEAMWEYACRAGTRTRFWTGEAIDTDQANYNGEFPYRKSRKAEYRKSTTKVDRFDANKFGLYDMHGNVLEWCADYWHANYNGAPIDGTAWLNGETDKTRVVRGGSWRNIAKHLRSAFRHPHNLSARYSTLGFRCARVER